MENKKKEVKEDNKEAKEDNEEVKENSKKVKENNNDVIEEKAHLKKTVILAENHLNKAMTRNDDTKKKILEEKRELRENSDHGFTNLYNSDDFEALSELAQMADPINDKIIQVDELDKEIKRLKGVIKNPYFARIDFKFDGDDAYEQIYIGRSSLKQDTAYEMAVYDWRSPIAGMFYRFVNGEAFYDAPGGRMTGDMNLKRQYEIKDSELSFFFDSNLQIMDEFLKEMLSKNTSNKMKTVVETIQSEQDAVIRDIDSDLMMVQGVAGSGKTSIALHRIAYLMYQGLKEKLTSKNILIISPNQLFEEYISDVLPELGEENVTALVFEDLMDKVLRGRQIQSKNSFLECLISNRRYKNVVKASIEFKTSDAFYTIMNRLISDIPHRYINYADVIYEGQCIMTKEEIKRKVIAGLHETPLGQQLELIENYIFEQIIEVAKRTPDKGRLNKQERFEIREKLIAFLHLDLPTIYQSLFTDELYFKNLSDGLRLPEHINEICEFTAENLRSTMLQYDDATALTYMNVAIYGIREYKNIMQVVIDEAQDYYPLHYRIFHILFPHAKFTVLGDMNQTLDKEEDESMYENVKKILDKKKTSLATMNKSFRCTKQILDFSLQFLDKKAEILSFNREGKEPEIRMASDSETLVCDIADKIKEAKQSGYASIGLICKTRKRAGKLYAKLNQIVDVSLVGDNEGVELKGAIIMPVYMSKGLEFDAVIICDADAESYKNADDKKLLYIASTRALHELSLFSLGKPSVFICGKPN